MVMKKNIIVLCLLSASLFGNEQELMRRNLDAQAMAEHIISYLDYDTTRGGEVSSSNQNVVPALLPEEPELQLASAVSILANFKVQKPLPALSNEFSIRRRSYKCEVCEKIFLRADRLLAHSSLHSNEKPFPCYLCNASFTRSDRLNRHIKFCITGKKRFQCEQCKKEFNEKHHLKKHIKTQVCLKILKQKKTEEELEEEAN